MESVRMGEMVVSAAAGDELVAIGLGSCIGLTVIDRSAGVAGLAHIVLPDSGGAEGPAGKFADLAVPELIRLLVARGALKMRLEAVMVGGARMFSHGGAGLDIGARNTEAVHAALKKAGIGVKAAETGGMRGRTSRVIVAGEVTAHVAGGEKQTLLSMVRVRPRVAGAMG
jgi:chemotaxis protein CheD